MTTMLNVDHVTKRYGDRLAVDDVSFGVRAGEVVGLIGPNGAGKTTIQRCILGVVRPTEGGATVAGQPITQLADPARQVGFVLDPAGMDPSFRARAHLDLIRRLAGLPASRVDEVIDEYDLSSYANQRIKTLSMGQKKRVAMATAMLGEPRLIVLDEPTNGLDAEGIRWLRGKIRSHADNGGAVLISSHILSEVEKIIDSAVIIRTTVRYSGPLDDLTGHGSYSLEERYFQLVASPTHPGQRSLAESGATPERTLDHAVV